MSNYPDNFDPYSQSAYSPPVRRGSGCLRGCTIAGIILLILMVLLAAGAYWLYRQISGGITTEPAEIAARLRERFPNARVPAGWQGRMGMRLRLVFEMDLLIFADEAAEIDDEGLVERGEALIVLWMKVPGDDGRAEIDLSQINRGGRLRERRPFRLRAGDFEFEAFRQTIEFQKGGGPPRLRTQIEVALDNHAVVVLQCDGDEINEAALVEFLSSIGSDSPLAERVPPDQPKEDPKPAAPPPPAEAEPRDGMLQDSLTLAVTGLQQAQPEPGLLVIGPQAFQEALTKFVTFKSTFLPTRFVALETIYKRWPTADEPEAIKRYLHLQWRAGQCRYVLLVGDVDVLPVRYMVLDRVTPAAFDYAFYPSDLYYADVAKEDGTFDDWNGQKEGFHARYYGEVRGEKNKDGPINFDEISYIPELAVGRWPVSTPEEARLVAEKSMRYEGGLANRTKPGANRLGLFAVDGWVDSRPILRAAGLRLKEWWDLRSHLYGQLESPPTEQELYRLLHEGAGLIIHAGHGETDRWDGCCTRAGLARIENADRLPILFSAGCSTAYFAPLPPYEAYVDVDGVKHAGTNAGQVFTAPPPPPNPLQRGKYNPTGLGEFALRNSASGAVAYIGCNTGSQPCGLTLVEGFTLELANQRNQRLGDLWVATVRHYHDKEKLDQLRPTESWYPPSIFFQAMKFMVFGDPTLPLP